MRALTREVATTEESTPKPSNYALLRVTCWAVALFLGAAQAWATRFTMNPDGVSYLDIGDAYWRGDWHNAINAYWSPLYSWILGFFFKVLKPSMYWEYPLVHLVNFMIYVASLACFEYFLWTFIEDRKMRDRKLLPDEYVGLSQTSWWLLGYSLFISCSVLLIGLRLVMPDLCVAAIVYLASAATIKIANGGSSTRTYLLFGVVLGFGYLAKSVMFPIGVVFLFGALISNRAQWNRIGTAALVFLAISLPFVAAISVHKGRLTIGESGRWNFLIFVDGVRPFLPQGGPPVQRPRKLMTSPNVYDYSHTLAGTFPPWIDPSYWQDGINTHMNVQGQLRNLRMSLSSYWHLVSDTFLHFGYAVGFLLLLLIFSARPRLSRDLEWQLLLPAAAAIAAFSLLLVLYRYVAPFVLMIWVVLFAALRFSPSREKQSLVQFVVICTAIVGTLAPALESALGFTVHPQPTCWEGAAALREKGVQPGASIALIWNEDWESDAVTGTFIPRLLRARVVGEAEPARTFWSSRQENQEKVLGTLFGIGADAIIAHKPPSGTTVGSCWHQLGETEFSACLPDAGAPAATNPATH